MTQQQRILKHLRHQGEIHSWEAIQRYGITRLSAIIFNLREIGLPITTEMKRVETLQGDVSEVAVYHLEEDIL
jgi:hypothetical protein